MLQQQTENMEFDKVFPENQGLHGLGSRSAGVGEGAGEKIAWSVRSLLYKCNDLSLVPRTHVQ